MINKKYLIKVAVYAALSTGFVVGTNALMDYLVYSLVGKDRVNEAFLYDLTQMINWHILSNQDASLVYNYWTFGNSNLSIKAQIASRILRLASLMQATGKSPGISQLIGLSIIMSLTAFVFFVRTIILVFPKGSFFKNRHVSDSSAILSALDESVKKNIPKHENKGW